MDGPGNAMPQGDTMHVYGITVPVSARNANLTTLANVVVSEEIHRIRSARWFTWLLGRTPFITAQLDEFPSGVGVTCIFTTHPDATVFPTVNSKANRSNRYDVTLGGAPVELGATESFQVDFEAQGVTPSPTVELYWSVHFWGTLLRGIRG